MVFPKAGALVIFEPGGIIRGISFSTESMFECLTIIKEMVF